MNKHYGTSDFASIGDNLSVCQQKNGQTEYGASLQQASQTVVCLFSGDLGLWYIHTEGSLDCGMFMPAVRFLNHTQLYQRALWTISGQWNPGSIERSFNEHLSNTNEQRLNMSVKEDGVL